MARLDSARDEMTGNKTYTVWLTSVDSVQTTYGWADSQLMLRCSTAQKDPKWFVLSGMEPYHTFGATDMGTMQMKTDSEFVSDVVGDYVGVGRIHGLRALDNKNFTKRIMKSKSLILRWRLLTNDVVTFHYDVTTLIPLVPQLYAICGKTVPQ
jgi:hypothetical protein